MNDILQTAYKTVSAFSYYIPHALASLLLLGLSAFIYIKIKNRKGEDEETGGLEEDQDPGSPRHHRSASWFKLRKNLRRALATLKANVYGRHHRYQIPWFLLVGETGSGKTEALHHTDITLPLGAPEENLEGSREGWKWWFFDQGIVIDVDGDYVLRTDGQPTDHRGWRHVLNLLQKNRPQRPVDGIILTIPATDLVGPAETLNERVIKIGDKAAALFDKMVTAQKILGMRLPVYVLVTKCDHVRGFKSFCGELPKGLQQDILGWSNPYTLDTAYTPKWLDEAFENLYKNLYQTQIEVIVDGIQVQDSDDFFVFPSEFNSMLEPLRTYANHLFKQSVYHEALFMRGLFFCGDAALNAAVPMQNLSLSAAEPQPVPVDSGLETFDSDGPQSPRRLAFLKDFLELKVFPEFRLARPTAKVFLWRSRLTWALRSAIAGIVLIWTLGMWWGFSQLQDEKQTLEPLLADINEQLRYLKVRGPEEDLSFNKMALNLLKGMTNVNTTTLSSVFIPRSWFSDLDDQIRQSMVVAYDKIILKSLFFELEEKVKTTLEQAGTLDPGDSLEASAAPVKFDDIPQMKRLKKVITDLEVLWKNVQLYNGLHNSKDLTQLGDVVKYLFGFDLPVDFYQNAAYYHNALKDVEYRLYDPTITRYLLAIPKVRGLAQDLFIRLFEDNLLLVRLEDFAKDLETIPEENVRSFTPGGESKFDALLRKIGEMKALVARPEFAWMGGMELNFGKGFNEVMASIETSPFLGPDLKNEIEETGKEGFHDLTFQLRSQETSFTGPLLHAESGFIQMHLSNGVIKVEKALQEFLSHDFMKVEDKGEELITEIAPNDRLTWDPELLQASVNLYEDYKEFEHLTLPRFPSQLKPMVQRTSMRRLESSMNRLVARGQTFKPIREQFAFNRKEEELAQEIRSFKKAAPHLGQLMDIFFELDFTESSYTLFDLVTRHGYHLLNNVDRMLESEALYEFKDGNFSWWNGLTPASLEAYEALDDKELSYYLSIQRERIKYLARQYAEPLVNFLVNRTIKRGQLEERLVTKWHRVLVELDRYDARRTQNTLTLLERFIKVEMETITPENCLEKIPARDLKVPVRDFFGQNLHNLKVELSKQCRLLAKDEVLKNYSVVQAFFNNRLAGKYPFVPLTDRTVVDEANPADLRHFYRLLDRYLDQGLGQLEKSTKFGLSKDNALEFIYLMEEARPFFAPYLALEKSELSDYLLEVDFRVNREAETGANQVIEWQLETRGQAAHDHQTKKTPLLWDLGDPIRVTFRWAKNSPDIPVSAGDWPGANVEKRTVTYEYDNQWSLIQLLSRHEAGIEDFGPLGDPKPHTLRFQVNTLERDEERMQKEIFEPRSSDARLFVRVVVRNPQNKERVVMPAFPAEAPELRQGVNS
ncbi:MAG: hypothetical protein KC553_00125 [Nitrospina sp.]|nr:hypothetical protein [Nitrospina sp.]